MNILHWSCMNVNSDLQLHTNDNHGGRNNMVVVKRTDFDVGDALLVDERHQLHASSFSTTSKPTSLLGNFVVQELISLYFRSKHQTTNWTMRPITLAVGLLSLSLLCIYTRIHVVSISECSQPIGQSSLYVRVILIRDIGYEVFHILMQKLQTF